MSQLCHKSSKRFTIPFAFSTSLYVSSTVSLSPSQSILSILQPPSLSLSLYPCLPLSPPSSMIPPSVLCISIFPPLCASGQTSWVLVYPLIVPAAEKSRRAATQTELLRQEVISQIFFFTYPPYCFLSLSLSLHLLMLLSVKLSSVTHLRSH